VIEARAAGADAVLLIVAALDDTALAGLIDLARAEGLAALVEVHDLEEASRALACGATTIGVNSRNLRTLEVSPAVFEAVAPRLPRGVTAVAESGLRHAADLTRLGALGYAAFLIGERFMGEADPGAALQAMLAAAGEPAGRA
jgi:indole-3-glycerol phosphate synthase